MIFVLVLALIVCQPIYAVEHDETLYQFYEPVVYNLTPTERELVEQVVACEAGADSTDGQMMIAQCIMDYSLDNGLSIEETMSALQIHTYNRTVTEENSDAVSAVFDDGARVTDEHCYWWYQPSVCNGSWHETQKYVYTSEAGHKFFTRW